MDVAVISTDASRAARAPVISQPGGRSVAPPGSPRFIGLLYILPALVFYGLFTLAPAIHTVWLSFFTWDGVGKASWAGLANYRTAITDTELQHAFLHSLFLIGFYSVLPIVLGLFVTTLISRSLGRGGAVYRTILFLPQVMTTVALAVVWRWIFAYDGPLNQAFKAVGLGDATKAWLGDFTWALPSLGIVGTWTEFGLCMVLFIAGVQKIPQSLYDAAQVDGAGRLREFFAVTLPALRHEIVVVAVLTIIAALRTFDLVYITTRGGPGTSTTVPSLEIYERAFTYGQVGAAAAVATLLAIIIALMAFVVTRVGEGARP